MTTDIEWLTDALADMKRLAEQGTANQVKP